MGDAYPSGAADVRCPCGWAAVRFENEELTTAALTR